MAKKKTLDEVYYTIDSGSLIGISNHLKDYQMAYYINKLLNVELEREKDFYYSNTKKEKKKVPGNDLFSVDFQINDAEEAIPYTLYTCIDHENHLMYVLLNIRSQGVILHETFKTFDRLLFVFGRDHVEASKNLCSFQKEIPSTLLMQLFDFSSVKETLKTKEVLSKDEKNLRKTYDFLNNELLPEIEMYFIEMVSEKEKPKDIIF